MNTEITQTQPEETKSKKSRKSYQGTRPTFDYQKMIRCKIAVQRRIMQLCDSQDISLNALCYISGVTQSTMNNIISGRNNSTNVSTILKLCDGLNITLPEFFDADIFRNLDQEIF